MNYNGNTFPNFWLPGTGVQQRTDPPNQQHAAMPTQGAAKRRLTTPPLSPSSSFSLPPLADLTGGAQPLMPVTDTNAEKLRSYKRLKKQATHYKTIILEICSEYQAEVLKYYQYKYNQYQNAIEQCTAKIQNISQQMCFLPISQQTIAIKQLNDENTKRNTLTEDFENFKSMWDLTVVFAAKNKLTLLVEEQEYTKCVKDDNGVDIQKLYKFKKIGLKISINLDESVQASAARLMVEIDAKIAEYEQQLNMHAMYLNMRQQ